MSKTLLRHTLIKNIFDIFVDSLSLYIFTIWKSIVYYRLCRAGIYFDKILVSEYKLFNFSSDLYRKEMDRQLNKTLFLSHLIFPRSYHQSAWAFTMWKSVHMSRIQYDALGVRNSDMVQANVKGNLNVLSVQRKTTRASIVITIRSAPIVVNLTWLNRKKINISWKNKRSKKLNQKAIFHTLRREWFTCVKIICQYR